VNGDAALVQLVYTFLVWASAGAGFTVGVATVVTVFTQQGWL
jgi:hypothetical protein